MGNQAEAGKSSGYVCRENSLMRHGQRKDCRDPSTPARSQGSFAVGQDDKGYTVWI